MIEVRDLHVEVPGFALRGVSFRVQENAYCMLMGATGSGKTTILEVVCGLRAPQGGQVLLAGQDVTRSKPGERQIGYVPQDGAIFPTMRIRDQIEFPLRLRRQSASSIRQRVDELAELLGIERLLGRMPKGLSGGERQRIALARALAFRPRLLCMDEPLSALDEGTRRKMHELLGRVQQRERATVLHITHSTAESRILGTQWLQLEAGAVRDGNPGAPQASAISPNIHPGG